MRKAGLVPGWAPRLCAAVVALASAAPATASEPVRAVLFVSPTCPHCRTVEQAVPSWMARFGSRLLLARVSTATPSGREALLSTCQRLGVQRPVVPLLVVGDQLLVGSLEIPARFPALAEDLLARGGSPWPDVPGLDALAPDAAPLDPAPVDLPRADEPGPLPTPRLPATVLPLPEVSDQAPGPLSRIAQDLPGNSLAILVLVAMLVMAARSFVLLRRPAAGDVDLGGWASPVLSLLGLGVAAYLAWVETAQVEAVCGPVGDCNTVQQSPYARLFGVLPVGVLGVAGFAGTLATWLVGRFGRPGLRAWAAAVLLVSTTLGLLFSTYLTFLEPFVIGATCLWCLTSATILTLLHALSLAPGRAALAALSSAAALPARGLDGGRTSLVRTGSQLKTDERGLARPPGRAANPQGRQEV